MANSTIAVSQGSGKNLATYSVSEDAATKEIQRASLNNSSGSEIGTSGSPLRIDPTGTTTQPVSVSGVSTAANQTNGSQKTQIVDGSGNVIGATSNALDVNIKSGAASGTQYTEGDTDATITGTAIMFESNTGTSALSAVSNSTPLPISDAGGAITVDGTVSAAQSGTWNVTNISGTVSLPTGASTSANQSTIIGHLDGVEGLLTTIDADTGNLPTIETNTDFGTVTGGGTETGALRVTIANNSTGVLSVDDNGGSLTVDAPVGTPVFVRLSDGSSAITTLPVSLASVPSHAVTNAGTFATQVSSSTTGGYTPGKLISAASTNATSVKASAGTIGYITASNINAAARYLKLYNKASTPTVGTDTPVHTFLIPGNTAGAGTNIPLPSQGIGFSTGIAFALTTGATDADTGAVAASEIIINYGWI